MIMALDVIWDIYIENKPANSYESLNVKENGL